MSRPERTPPCGPDTGDVGGPDGFAIAYGSSSQPSSNSWGDRRHLAISSDGCWRRRSADTHPGAIPVAESCSVCAGLEEAGFRGYVTRTDLDLRTAQTAAVLNARG